MEITDIRETIKSVLYAEDVELIEVPVKGEDAVFLRVKTLPEFAFVLHAGGHHSTKWHLNFVMPDDISNGWMKGVSHGYYVVCLCQSCEDCSSSWYQNSFCQICRFLS